MQGLILAATLTLDYFRLVGHFGGGPGGSFGMLYLPSVVFYLAAGFILGVIVQVAKGRKTGSASE